ncbi:MAG: hypothetical protein FWC79_07320 [Oscillospiraceae bacterium]|nr:hypothetical protein [Oscillospiraceae bacterium]
MDEEFEVGKEFKSAKKSVVERMDKIQKEPPQAIKRNSFGTILLLITVITILISIVVFVIIFSNTRNGTTNNRQNTNGQTGSGRDNREEGTNNRRPSEERERQTYSVSTNSQIVGVWEGDGFNSRFYVFNSDGTGGQGFGEPRRDALVDRFEEWFTSGSHYLIVHTGSGSRIMKYTIEGQRLTLYYIFEGREFIYNRVGTGVNRQDELEDFSGVEEREMITRY